MCVLVLNCGSSSIKFAIISPQNEEIVLSGLAEKLGLTDSSIRFDYNHQQTHFKLDLGSYEQAFKEIQKFIQDNQLLDSLLAVGHRVVHGGSDFINACFIDDEVLAKIEQNIELAPLHNPQNLNGIKFSQQVFSSLPQFAIFDTAFHQTMSKPVYSYPINKEICDKYNIRKYGFHGTSHKYVSEKATELLGLPSAGNFITLHLGNGCSVAAVKQGKSVDISMGFTPLAGLMMGTRSGDIDVGILEYLAGKMKLDIVSLVNLLNKSSGLLGICGHSDMREIEELYAAKDENAILAVEMFCLRIARYVASYLIYFDKLDAIVFTGGIGENSKFIRTKVTQLLNNLGVCLDENINQASPKNKLISNQDSKYKLMVISTNEELMIAKEAYNKLMSV